MNIKDLQKKPFPEKYTDEGKINIQWLYEVINSYEEHGLVGAVLSIGEENGTDVKITKEVYLEEAAINIFSYAGATVVQADFNPDKKTIFNMATNLCKNWINLVPTNKIEFCSLTLVPLIFKGEISILFSNLIYYDSHLTNSYQRLVMVFDESVTQIMTNEDINFEELSQEAEREALSEIKKLDEENYAISKEIEEMEKTHMFEDRIKDNMQEIIDPTSRVIEEKMSKTQKRETNPFMRISNDSSEGENINEKDTN